MSFVLPFKEGTTIIELGGGDNPIIKRIPGLKSINVDVRQVLGVDIVRNLEGDFSDIGQFDGIFANFLLEHLSWRKVTHFLEQCYKILKPDTFAVFVVPDTYAQMQKILEKKPEEITLEDSNFLFGGQDFSDNTHKWLLSRPLVINMFKEVGFSEVEIIDYPDPVGRDMIIKAYKGVVSPDKLVKLNLGSFTVSFNSNWINCDIRVDIKPALEAKGHIFEYCDVTKPLRWNDNSVDIITAHHLIEHLDRDEGDIMLKECLRVLKPSGVIRLSTPDLDKFIEMLPRFKDVYANEFEAKNAKDNTDAFFRLAFMGHKTIYNYDSLCKKMKNIGFVEMGRMGAGQSRSQTIISETTDSFPDHSFYIEATKAPSNPQQESKPIITVGKQLQPYQRYLKGEIDEGSQDAVKENHGDESSNVSIIIPTTKQEYVSPFKHGQKILELGGGENPIFRPNMDFRELPTVDIVSNLEGVFPIEDEGYDGVFGNMMLEHIGWRYISHISKEVFRVLKSGGVGVFITPNTLEQCKEIVNRNKVGIEENALLFGGQEGTWEETGNYHKSAFSPNYVKQVFTEAGFTRVETKPLPGCHWDMIIEAYKQ